MQIAVDFGDEGPFANGIWAHFVQTQTSELVSFMLKHLSSCRASSNIWADRGNGDCCKNWAQTYLTSSPSSRRSSSAQWRIWLKSKFSAKNSLYLIWENLYLFYFSFNLNAFLSLRCMRQKIWNCIIALIYSETLFHRCVKEIYILWTLVSLIKFVS